MVTSATPTQTIGTGPARDLPQPGRLERALVGTFVRSTVFPRRHGREWPVPRGMPHRTLRFRGNGGADVSARLFPHRDPRGVVVLAHPDRRYGQHWFVREGWIPWLREAGFAALTFDFANYGGTRGGSTYLFEDVLAAAGVARAEVPGVPLHAVGLSIGAFSVANASPHLEAESLVLESPYPSFASWYEGARHRRGSAAMTLFERAFPRTAALVRADERIRHARAKRILVAASAADEVTPAHLSRRVADAAPKDRTTYLELPAGRHLSLFDADATYREAVLATLLGAQPRQPRVALSRALPAERRDDAVLVAT